jgi:uncharacterized circularly permuted ATP-grasp superfamily protein/uncharacterized alpha-E superfamily protein
VRQEDDELHESDATPSNPVVLATGGSTASTMSSRLFGSYRPVPGLYDELVAHDGQLRPNWNEFAVALDDLGTDELARRWEQARKLIYENGVTYNVYGDARGMDRPWELDAIPLLIGAGEWERVSAALVQRAELLNLILSDLYGPQRILSEGWLPAELVYGNPGFLRPCHGTRVPTDCYLHFYAADIARSHDGQWWVLTDRTQAPAGAGYALENRLVISRMLPQIFHESRVQRLASFFLTLRETLRGLAPHNRENPRIVLLSAGPSAETYFEDAYLSRYLGYTLVEGDDLAVRNERVYLKTLGGLLPVDVILRRLSDELCDPLEFRRDSLQGAAGIMQAARSGTVAVANAFGSGLLEMPAIMAYLPVLCRRLLGQDLMMPSVATWWCGNPQATRYVLQNLDRLVIKPTYPSRGVEPVFGAQLTTREREHLADRIKAAPRRFVAQEQVARSSAPVWTNGGVQAWHLALRAFLCASGQSYSVMQGALTRMSASLDLLGTSMAVGEGSKDAWVLSDQPVQQVSLLRPAGQGIELRRSGSDLPSRVADHLFWLGRLVERVEGAVRILRNILVRLTSESDPSALPELPPLWRALSDQGHIPPDTALREGREFLPGIETELLSAIFDEQRSGSLHSTLNAVHRTASIVRDRISIDSWRILNRLDREFSPPLEGFAQLSDALAVLNQMIINLAAFSGLGMESMTRSQGWRFLDMGRRIERSLHTIHLLRSTLVSALENEAPVLEALLEIADSSMTYRTRYLTTLQLAPVLDLLLLDETNPRSLGFQLAALGDHVEELPRDRTQPFFSIEQRIMMAMLTSLRLADIEILCELDKEGTRKNLDRLLSRCAGQLPKLSDSIMHKYLIHAGPPRQMAEILPD